MECRVCGAAIPDDSVYCQKCGRKLDEIGVSAKDISVFLTEKMETSDIAEIQQYYQTLIDKVGQSRFHSVEIHRSSHAGIDLTDLIYEEGDLLHIGCQDSADYLKLTAAFLINESDARQTELDDIMAAFHDDRMAKLNTAYAQYKRAMLTKETSRKVGLLDEAANICILGMNELKKEISGHLDLFAKIPKSTIGKLFCGVSLQTAEAHLAQIQESFPWYCDALRLLMNIDMQNQEMGKLDVMIEEEKDYLKRVVNSKGYRRLLEIDEENTENWENDVKCLEVDMYYVGRLVEADTATIKILEEKKNE